jgi:hypothetical protein
MDGRSSVKRGALGLVVCAIIGVSSPALEAQGVRERIRQAAEEARKALEAKAKAAEDRRKTDEQPNQTARPGGRQGAVPPAVVPASSAKVEAEVVSNVGSLRDAHFSPRGVHLATIVQRGSRWVVTLDGVDGPRFDEILVDTQVKFSPDGTRFLYMARQGEEYVLMVDGKEMTRFPRADNQFGVLPAFTSNSKHVYFAVRHSGTGNPENYCRLFVDGQPGPRSYGGGGDCKPTFSPDGERYLQVINPAPNPGSPPVLVVDGKPAGYPGPGYQMVDAMGYDPAFTADGKHLFIKTQHTAGQEAAQVMFLDGKPWIRAQGVTVHIPPVGDRVVAVVSAGRAGTSSWHMFLHVDGQKVAGSECLKYVQVDFSPDGRRYAARCEGAGRQHSLVIDGKKGQEYNNILNSGFTPDSSKVVYLAEMGLKYFVVIDDEESDGYMSVSGQDPAALPVAFGAGGKRIGYIAQSQGQGCLAVVDGKGTPYKTPACVGALAFSPDGSRYAYGQPGGILVVDGAELTNRARMFSIGATGPVFVFSPDSKQMAYLTTIGADTTTAAVVVNDRYILLPSAQVFLPTFTPDGRHFIFATRAGAGYPLGHELVIYVDGRPAARFQGGAQTFPIGGGPTGPAAQDSISGWQMGADGVLTFLVQDGMDASTAEIKRVRITPPSDTNVDTMLAEARPVPAGRK